MQFLEKMQKLSRKLPKCFANCELRMANSNPGFVCKNAPSFTQNSV